MPTIPGSDVYLYDLTTGTESWLTPSVVIPAERRDRRDPAISGNWVVWDEGFGRAYYLEPRLAESSRRNRGPILESIPDRTIRVGGIVHLEVNAADPDGDPLVMETHPAPLPGGATLETVRSEPGILTKVLRWTPTPEQTGTYRFFFLAMDPSDFSDPEEVYITVTNQPTFIRGDANGDGVVDISDVVTILLYLYRGQKVPVLDTCDVNDDGQVNVTDAIALANHLLQGGRPPAPPYPDPGSDPSPDNLH